VHPEEGREGGREGGRGRRGGVFRVVFSPTKETSAMCSLRKRWQGGREGGMRKNHAHFGLHQEKGGQRKRWRKTGRE